MCDSLSRSDFCGGRKLQKHHLLQPADVLRDGLFASLELKMLEEERRGDLWHLCKSNTSEFQSFGEAC